MSVSITAADGTTTVAAQTSGVANADGAWRVSLAAQAASPLGSVGASLSANDGTTTVTLTGILFGDVYV